MNTKNMIKLLLITIVSLIAFSSVFAQNSNESNPTGAREVMVKFVELNNKQLLQTDEAQLLLSGDATDWKMPWLGQISGQPDKIVAVEKNFSVARVQTIVKNSRVMDVYFYLRFDNGWKINSLRAMAQTGWLESIRTALSGKTELTAEEKETLANAELTLSSDKTLTEWFQKDRLAFDKLAALALAETKPKPKTQPRIKNRRANKHRSDGYGVGYNPVMKDDFENYEALTVERITGNTKNFPKSATALKNLHLTALETKTDGSIEITIGGVTDNAVGFIYSPKEKPPAIDGRSFIWVEKIAAGWYLFRTT